MAADRPAAGWAAPFLLLRLQETLHPIIPDCIQVFDHAHVVFSAIAFIQAFQAFAGVFSTFKTKPDASVCQQFARIVHMRAIFSSRNASRAIFFVKSPFVEIIFLELISDA